MQPNIPMENGGHYKLSFDAYAEEEKNIAVRIAGNTFDVPLTKENTKYQFTVELPHLWRLLIHKKGEKECNTDILMIRTESM